MTDPNLATYLNDHLAGAVAARTLACAGGGSAGTAGRWFPWLWDANAASCRAARTRRGYAFTRCSGSLRWRVVVGL